MAYTRMTASEAAELIHDGDNIAIGGFTPNGDPKAVFRELSKRAVREHEAGHPFKVGIFSGASSCQSIEGDMALAHAIKFRAPFSTNKDFREHVNLEEIEYEDMHLGHMAERLRHGVYGTMDWLIIEASDIVEGTDECRLSLTSAGGIATTAARLARRIIIELNHFHSPRSRILHDTFEPGECGFGRQPIPIIHVLDRIGKDYISIDPKKIVCVVECNIPEEARQFKALTPTTEQMGNNVAEFLVADMKAGRIPPQFLPIQSGVGATGNAVLAAMGKNHHIPSFEVYSEVVQDAAIDLIEKGQIKAASATAMTVTNEALHHVYDNIDFFAKHLVIRQSEIASGI